MKRVNRYKTLEQFSENFWKEVDKTGKCWIWLAGKDKNGYGRCRVRFFTTTFAHRIAYMLVNKIELPSSVKLLHDCDNPECVNPAHTFQGTQAENMKDCSRKNRAGGSEFSEEKIQEIRRTFSTSKLSMEEFGKQHGVSHMTISRIIREKTYANFQQHTGRTFDTGGEDI